MIGGITALTFFQYSYSHASPTEIPESITLQGKWKFFPNQFLSLENLLTAAPVYTVPVPAEWHEYPEMNRFGFGTYYLKTTLPNPNDKWTLSIYQVNTAYELEINGRIVEKVGTIGTSTSQTRPAYRPIEVILPEGQAEIEIVIRAANFHHRRGGLIVAPMLSPSSSESTGAGFERFIFAVLVGGSLILIILQVLYWLWLREEVYLVYFAIFFLAGMIKMLCVYDRLLYTALGPDFWPWGLKAEVLSLYLMNWAISLGMVHYFREASQHQYFRVSAWFFGLTTVLVLFLPTAWLSWSMMVFVPTALAGWSQTTWLAWRGIRLKTYASKAILLTNLLMGVLAPLTMGILGDVPIINWVEIIGAQITVIGLGLGLVRILVERIQRIKALSNRLQEAHGDLEAQNRNLESEVLRRAKELTHTEREVTRLALDLKQKDLEFIQSQRLMKEKMTENVIQKVEELLPKA